MLALPGRNREERQEEIRLFQRVLCAGEKERSQRDKEAQQCREIGSSGRQAPNEDKAAKVALKDDTTPPGGQGGQVRAKSLAVDLRQAGNSSSERGPSYFHLCDVLCA